MLTSGLLQRQGRDAIDPGSPLRAAQARELFLEPQEPCVALGTAGDDDLGLGLLDQPV